MLRGSSLEAPSKGCDCTGLGIPQLWAGRRNRRFKMDAEVVNFFVHCDSTLQHVLKLKKYNGDYVDLWVLLEVSATA